MKKKSKVYQNENKMIYVVLEYILWVYFENSQTKRVRVTWRWSYQHTIFTVRLTFKTTMMLNW